MNLRVSVFASCTVVVSAESIVRGLSTEEVAKFQERADRAQVFDNLGV